MVIIIINPEKHSMVKSQKNSLMIKLLLPPTLRFLLELTTWIWLLLAGFWYLTLLSIFALSIFNAKDDKKFEGIQVPGYFRVLIELLSALLGIIGAYLYFHLLLIGFLQCILVLFTLVLDKDRLKWLLGIDAYPPLYVRPYYEKLYQKSIKNKESL